MVKAETYIKENDNFILIDDFDKTVPDPMYVEGAIYLEIDGRKIMTLDLWDDVNWLWGFIVTGLEDLQENPEWTTGFPDQPIKLTIKLNKNRADVELHLPQSGANIKPETRRASAPLNEFLTAIEAAGRKYFARISKIGGEDGSREARRLSEAVQKLYTFTQ